MARYCPYCVSKIEEGDSCPNCNYEYYYEAKPYHLRPGTLLRNKYLVGRVLGEGGFGITYVGRDLTLDMKVAIKEYYPNRMAMRTTGFSTTISLVDWSFSEEFKRGKEQFIQEAQTIAKMDKESAVVTVRDFFEENNSAYIVMEFIEGEDLHARLSRTRRPMESGELFSLLEPLFGAIDDLHAIGLIHRDISPDNIMVENDRARLIDFGCARDTSAAQDAEAVLKHGFSPPEQYENREMGPWTDVYAMAATIYYCLTGKLPPKATDRLMKDELRRPRALGAKLTGKQERALMKALSLKKEERYASLVDFGKDLFPIKKNKSLTPIAAVLALILVGGAIYVWRHPQRAEDITIRAELPVANIPELIVPLEDESVSTQERQMVNEIVTFLQESWLVCTEQVSYRERYEMILRNATEYDVEKATFYIRFLSADGVDVCEAQDSISKWSSGDAFVAHFADNTINYHDSAETAELHMRLWSGEKWIDTDYVPVLLDRPSPDGSQTENRGAPAAVFVKVSNKLPQTFTDHSYYQQEDKISITEVSKSPDSSSAYVISGTYVSGTAPCYFLDVDYKLTDKNGVVYDSGSIYIDYLYPGDRFEEKIWLSSDLPPGEYLLTFIEAK